MSLPSILDYLPEVGMKLAEVQQPPKKEPIALNPKTLRAGLQSAATIALGTGAGYGAGKLLGYGADALSKKLTGQPVPSKYFPPAVAGLGLLGSLALIQQRKRHEEILRHAHESSADRAARRAT